MSSELSFLTLDVHMGLALRCVLIPKLRVRVKEREGTLRWMVEGEVQPLTDMSTE